MNQICALCVYMTTHTLECSIALVPVQQDTVHSAVVVNDLH